MRQQWPTSKRVVKVAGNIPVLEDTAQSCGGTRNGKYLGTFGAFGTFSFDAVKTLTTGEGGMIITNDQDLYVRASEYHDHGHDHLGAGRGNDSRSFVGFNYRMMEIQGALGLAQLKKVPMMVEKQRANKKRLKDHLAGINGITFRTLPDPAGDTATFLMFALPTAEKAEAFNKVLSENNAGSVYWYKNTWHFYDHWEHLLGQKTVLAGGWPFKRPDGRVLDFPAGVMSKTAEILSRYLTWPININMPEADFERLLSAADKAAKVL